MMETRRLRDLRTPLRWPIRSRDAALFCCGQHRTCSACILGIVQKAANVVDEQGVEHFGDLFLVCEVEGSFKGDPVTS